MRKKSIEYFIEHFLMQSKFRHIVTKQRNFNFLLLYQFEEVKRISPFLIVVDISYGILLIMNFNLIPRSF